MLFILLFPSLFFLGGKEKGEKNNQDHEFKYCLSARSSEPGSIVVVIIVVGVVVVVIVVVVVVGVVVALVVVLIVVAVVLLVVFPTVKLHYINIYIYLTLSFGELN